jgi:hypothetical protein
MKAFFRPNVFNKVLHFFYYGLPEFDLTLEDRPNDFETDFEKLPPLKMQIELSDS